MSPISDPNVEINSMPSTDVDMIIMVVTVVGAVLVSMVVGGICYCCLVARRKMRKLKVSAGDLSPSNMTNSYIHYGSPGNSVQPVRKTKKYMSDRRKASLHSERTQSSSNSFIDKFKDSLDEESMPLEEKKMAKDKLEDEAVITGYKKPIKSVDMSTCQNLSAELSVLGLTDSTPNTLHITASTSLCEQCLSAPPSPMELAGTSISLPPTALEMTKSALGMTNPASALPVVCDTCLSPSKFGETSRSLKLPLIGQELLTLSRKMSPSGIVTNPRMKNPLLLSLRESMNSNDMLETLISMDDNKFDDNLEISERNGTGENSFDSLLSPSKDVDWLSGDPFDVSSESGNSGDDPRMVRIQPKIKVRKPRLISEGSIKSTAGQDTKCERFYPGLDELGYKSASIDDLSKCLLSPPSRNQAAVSNVTPLSANAAKKCYTPSLLQESAHNKQIPQTPPLYSPYVINQFYPILPPPAAFQSPSGFCNQVTSSKDIPHKDSKSSITSPHTRDVTKPHSKGPSKSPFFFQFPSNEYSVTTPERSAPIETTTSSGIPASLSTPKGLITPNRVSLNNDVSISMTPPLYSPYMINNCYEANTSQSLDCLARTSPCRRKPTLTSKLPSPSQVSNSGSVTSTPSSSKQPNHQTYVIESPFSNNNSGGIEVSNNNLAWDSTFEALKTLECSMKLAVTPLHKKLDETYEDSPQESNDSQLSGCVGDKSCVSTMSLAWDNTGEQLAGGDQSHSSMESLDIDMILSKVAPELISPRCEDPQLTPMPKQRNFPYSVKSSVKSRSDFETSSPMTLKLAPRSETDTLADSPDSGTKTPQVIFNTSDVMNADQFFPFSSPCPNFSHPPELYVRIPSDSKGHPSVNTSQASNLQSKVTSDSSLLLAPPAFTGSPSSSATEDFLSACGSMDSYSTAFEL